MMGQRTWTASSVDSGVSSLASRTGKPIVAALSNKTAGSSGAAIVPEMPLPASPLPSPDVERSTLDREFSSPRLRRCQRSGLQEIPGP